MNSDKAAAVRDAINGCPTVIGDDDVSQNYPSGPLTRTTRGVEQTHMGGCTQTHRSRFRPAYIEQSGTLGNGNGAKRPVFVVVLETLWTEKSDVRSLPAEMVYEIAKHDCSIRFYPPDHRLDGDIWITDHFAQEIHDSNGERCSDCGSTYFKIKDGEPECAKCGTGTKTVQTELGGVNSA